MSNIREIVTKAVVSKGTGNFKTVENIELGEKPFSILGCWIINNNFTANKIDSVVELDGNFEINIWYTLNNNTKTEIAKKVINYTNDVIVKDVVKDTLSSDMDVIVKMVQQPTCLNASINELTIEVEISYEVLAEVIGETKMKVSVFNPVEEDNIDVNEDFIEEF